MKLVAYYRVSTKEQGKSGLGLEGQRAAVQQHAKMNGDEIVGEFTEVETGKMSRRLNEKLDDRPKLRAALGHARRSGATLAIAKLDRLARNTAFVACLMESDVPFFAIDNRFATPLTIHILAAVAEDEARRISERTKAALQALKRRGVLLGSARPGAWEGREEARRRGQRLAVVAAAEARSKAAREQIADLIPTISALKSEGLTLQQMADRLNNEGHRSPNGAKWWPTTVLRAVRRI